MAHIVSSLVPRRILLVGVFLVIFWTCMPAGDVPLLKTDTVSDRLKVAKSIAL